MEEIILISWLNDFIFCPVSIYFHNLYGALNKTLYQTTSQINGTNAHKTIDNKTYSDKKSILQGMSVYCQEFGIQGKIDVLDVEKGLLTERKNKIVKIYDGYVYQLYAQYYALREMGYEVKKIRFHSIADNKNYDIKLPKDDEETDKKFRALIKQMHEFDPDKFIQTNDYEYKIYNGQYQISWKDSSRFVKLILEAISEYKEVIFNFILNYYRWFMKGGKIENFPKAVLYDTN